MTLTKVKAWNPTDPGRVAQVVVWGVRGTDGEAYVMEVDPSTGAFPIATGSFAVAPMSPTLRDFSTAPLLANTWSQLIASLPAQATSCTCINTSDEFIEVGFGTVSQFVVPPGGVRTKVQLFSASFQIQLRSVNAVAAGRFSIDWGV